MTKLDEPVRSVADLHSIATLLEGKGVAFKALDDAAVDTTSRTGKLVMDVLAIRNGHPARAADGRNCAGEG